MWTLFHSLIGFCFDEEYTVELGFPGGSVVKNPPAKEGNLGSIPGLGRSLEKEMATHSSILPWRISWTEEPGGLQSMWLQRVGHNLATKQQYSGISIWHLICTQDRKMWGEWLWKRIDLECQLTHSQDCPYPSKLVSEETLPRRKGL